MALDELLQTAKQNLPLVQAAQQGNLSEFTTAPPNAQQQAPTFTPPTPPPGPNMAQQAVGMQGEAQAEVNPSLMDKLGSFSTGINNGPGYPDRYAVQSGSVDPSIGPLINHGQGGFGSPGADIEAATMDIIARTRGVDLGGPGSYTGPDIDANGNKVIRIAKTQLGVPYNMGSYDPAGGGSAAIDCSGLTKWVFSRLGVELPHSAAQQSQMFPKLGAKDLKPGDLVFYDYGRLGGASDHVSIYAGNGMQIAASSSGGQVEVQPVDWDNFIWGGDTPLSGGQGQQQGGGNRRKTAPAPQRPQQQRRPQQL